MAQANATKKPRGRGKRTGPLLQKREEVKWEKLPGRVRAATLEEFLAYAEFAGVELDEALDQALTFIMKSDKEWKATRKGGKSTETEAEATE